MRNKHLIYVKLIRSVFNTEKGQELIGHWINDYVLNHGINPKDVNDTFVQLGERNFVLKLLKEMQIDPIQMQQRIKEYEQTQSEY